MNNTGDFLAYIDETSKGLEKTIHEALEFIQWEKIVFPDSIVFVKPNFTYPYYKEGITTSPEVLRNLLAVLRTRAKRVIVGETNGGSDIFTAEMSFKNHGMYDMCQEYDAELVNLSRLPARIIEDAILGKKVKVQVPNLLLDEVNCFISVAALKVHAMTTVTLGLKNLWGCYSDSRRGLYHQNLSHKIALLAKLLKPKITIIDGTYGLDKHGPMFGEPVKLDLLLAANSPVVADALGASVMGFKPQSIRHIGISGEVIPGTLDLSKVRINKDWTAYRKKFTIHRTLIDRFSVLFFNSYFLSKLIFQSPFTKLAYATADLLRSKSEKETANDIKNHAYLH